MAKQAQSVRTKSTTGRAISGLRAAVFGAVVGVALIFILFPVFPAPFDVREGDIATRDISAHGEVIVQEGQTISATIMEDLRNAGLADVHLQGDHVAAAVLAALLGALALGGYLYLFQPRDASSLPRLLLLALLIVLWVAAAKLLLGQVLPDDDRLFLAYLLPVAAAPMLVAASMAIAVSIKLGIYAATLSPGLIPISRRALARRATES